MPPDYMAEILRTDASAYAARIADWQYAEYAVDPQRWALAKYHVAQRVYAKRREPCGLRVEGEPVTWETRFAQMFHEPLVRYVGRIREAQREFESVAQSA